MNQQDLIKRYCQTVKGRQIIATSMSTPKLTKNEQEIMRKDRMQKFNLTEDDFHLSEEKLKIIQQSESNND